MHPEIPYLREAMIFLVAAGLIIPLVRKLGISPVLGFLFVGLLIGPYAMGRLAGDMPVLEYFVFSDLEGFRRFAELGVIFLLFTIGLELSVAQLWAMRRLVFGLGGAQVAASAGAIGLIAYLFGNSLVAATIFGLCLALSSTALVSQLLTENRRLNTPPGRSSFAILLFQDLAVVPILLFVGFAGSSMEGSLALSAVRAIAEAVLVITAIFLIGRVIIRPLMRFVASSGSRELFMAATLFLVLATAALTAQAGLSMALGAFLAGLLFADTEYRHQIASDIEPFKGLLLGLFFISIGMGLDIIALWNDIGWVLLAVFGLLALKATIIFILAKAFRLTTAVAAESAILMSQGGEFAFVVISAALSFALLETEVAQFVILVVVVTMFLTPGLAYLGRRVGLSPRLNNLESPERPDLPQHGQTVIIGGFGRVGKMLAELLEEQRIPYVAIDNDAELVAAQRARGIPIFFGDASQPHVLDHLGIEHAAAFTTTMDAPDSAEPVIRAIHETSPHVPIFARARDVDHARLLRASGAASAVPEAMEASLELCEQLLVGIGFPEDVARTIVDKRRVWQMETINKE